jgi:hypothetical protein
MKSVFVPKVSRPAILALTSAYSTQLSEFLQLVMLRMVAEIVAAFASTAIVRHR